MTKTIKTSEIIVGAECRKHSEGSILDMSNSIKNNGLLESLIIDSDYNLIAGSLRLYALILNKVEEVECKVVSGTKEELRLIFIDSNVVREDLSAIQKMILIKEKKELLDSMKVKGSAKKIADENNITSSMVHKNNKIINNLEADGLIGLCLDIENNSEDYFSRDELDKMSKSKKVQEDMKNGKLKTTNEARESMAEEVRVNTIADFYNQDELIGFLETKIEELKVSFENNDDKKIKNLLKKIKDYTLKQTNSKEK